MKTIKVPRKLKKAFKHAIRNKFPLGDWPTKELGICGISTSDRFTKRKSAVLVGGKALISYYMGRP